MHCVDLGESFPTSISLQKSASIQPRTSPSKFGGKCNSLFICLLSHNCFKNSTNFIFPCTFTFSCLSFQAASSTGFCGHVNFCVPVGERSPRAYSTTPKPFRCRSRERTVRNASASHPGMTSVSCGREPRQRHSPREDPSLERPFAEAGRDIQPAKRTTLFFQSGCRLYHMSTFV